MAYIGNNNSVSNIQKIDSLNFNSSTTSFSIKVNGSVVLVASSASAIISIGGVIQEPGIDYTISGSNITFTTAPTTGMAFFGILLGSSINMGIPSDGTITNAKLGETVLITKGGTGATTADAALTNLGATSVGKSLLTASSVANVRTQLGLGSAALLNSGSLAGNLVQLATDNTLPILDGSNLTGITTGKLVGVKTFYASGTYTPTAGTKKVLLVGRGSGGNGGRGGNGSSSGWGGGGGGGGAASTLYRVLVDCTTTQAVTVGANGAASAFGSLFTFPAGQGGIQGVDNGATGGAGGANPTGADDFSLESFSGVDGATAPGGGPWGAGGKGGGFGGGAGGAGVSQGGGAGGAATVRGGGGGGGEGGQGNGAGKAGGAGGAGGAGYIVVYEYTN
jgi:hypothetical protein